MTSAQWSGSPVRRSTVLAALAVALTVIVGIIAAATTPGSPATATPSATSDSRSTATAGPPPLIGLVDCRRDSGQMPAYLAGDPCPSAIAAVAVAVAPIELPVTHAVIVPGPLFCDVIWEGVGSPPPCFGPNVRAGQYMHAYVGFDGSSRVAVVMLGLDLPPDDNDPLATRPPWNTTIVAVEVPPAGWVMP